MKCFFQPDKYTRQKYNIIQIKIHYKEIKYGKSPFFGKMYSLYTNEWNEFVFELDQHLYTILLYCIHLNLVGFFFILPRNHCFMWSDFIQTKSKFWKYNNNNCSCRVFLDKLLFSWSFYPFRFRLYISDSSYSRLFGGALTWVRPMVESLFFSFSLYVHMVLCYLFKLFSRHLHRSFHF